MWLVVVAEYQMFVMRFVYKVCDVLFRRDYLVVEGLEAS